MGDAGSTSECISPLPVPAQWQASEQFYELYTAGKLDDGERAEDFSEWVGFYRLKLRREQALKNLSQVFASTR